ncbi:hypothetical protein KSP40_PGU022745 [Platanthera guangdongensis]|uniref:Uncharacterized protein n=1 Tax=Platanthera guangdongensis TaxID=2320717 RepID=A0ABR2M622_9ASPA
MLQKFVRLNLAGNSFNDKILSLFNNLSRLGMLYVERNFNNPLISSKLLPTTYNSNREISSGSSPGAESRRKKKLAELVEDNIPPGQTFDLREATRSPAEIISRSIFTPPSRCPKSGLLRRPSRFSYYLQNLLLLFAGMKLTGERPPAGAPDSSLQS